MKFLYNNTDVANFIHDNDLDINISTMEFDYPVVGRISDCGHGFFINFKKEDLCKIIEKYTESFEKRKDSIEKVNEFHTAFDRERLDKPGVPMKVQWALRIALLEEELGELKEAYENEDVVEVADAFADIQYILDGGIIEAGMMDIKGTLIKEVHHSNMSKLVDVTDSALQEELTGFTWVVGEDGRVGYLTDENGKIRKPTFFEAPDIKKILNENL